MPAYTHQWSLIESKAILDAWKEPISFNRCKWEKMFMLISRAEVVFARLEIEQLEKKNKKLEVVISAS